MAEEPLQASKILIVDDEAAVVRLLEQLLQRAGYLNVQASTDGRRALALWAEFQPDLVLLDLHMPRLTGFDVLEQFRLRIPEGTYLPVLVLTADASREIGRASCRE